MKILHITTVRVLPRGQRKQLEYEVEAAQKLDVIWDTVALHTEKAQSNFERQIPRVFRNRILLRVYGWIYTIRHSRDYDVVLFRDLQLDPLGPLFGPFVRNRITVHHAKEIQELSILRGGGFFSEVAVWIEKYIKPLTMRSAKGIVGVTSEIKDYEIERFPHLENHAYVMPNGYSFGPAKPLETSLSQSELNLIFVCAEFTVWHGLDRLLSAVKEVSITPGKKVKFHLVGVLNEEQLRDVREVSTDHFEFHCHGVLDKKELSKLYSISHLAIGSLALDRQGLTEAATLKTREYLAAGVPVYATHKETALPSDFPFFLNDAQGVSIERILDFSAGLGSVSREEIREISKVYLDKKSIMQKLVDDLNEGFAA